MRGLGPFLRSAWRLAVPYFRSSEWRSACVLLVCIIGLNLLLVRLNVQLNYWNGDFYNSLQSKDWDAFVSLLFTYRRTETGIMPGFVEIAAVFIPVAIYRTYLRQWLQIRWRRWLTARFLDAWLSDHAYYRIGLLRGPGDIGTDNPDQRIAEDVREFVDNTLILSLDLLTNIVNLFSFLQILWVLSGAVTLFGIEIPGYMVWIALIYAVLGTILTHLIGRPLVAINFRQQKVEADFRFSLVRLRENTEGVALYGGEDEERRVLVSRFSEVMANWWQIMQRTKLLNALVAGYGQVAAIFPIVVAAPRYFSGQIALGGLTRTASAFGQVQSSLSWFVESYASLAQWRATVDRLTSFEQAIVAARSLAGRGVAIGAATEPALTLEDATLSLPDGTLLLDRATLAFAPGQTTLITGRSGSGKSTLFRALAGIWPFGTGRVSRPPGTYLFLPQRPYIPLGSLRHAIAYPAQPSEYDDNTVEQALQAVGLSHLATQLDREEPWSQRLSGGEQQRLAIARAILWRPDWLFLDEATASLDAEAEQELYIVLREHLPGTSIISIAHSSAVAAFHNEQIVFRRAGGHPGTLTPVSSPEVRTA